MDLKEMFSKVNAEFTHDLSTDSFSKFVQEDDPRVGFPRYFYQVEYVNLFDYIRELVKSDASEDDDGTVIRNFDRSAYPEVIEMLRTHGYRVCILDKDAEITTLVVFADYFSPLYDGNH